MGSTCDRELVYSLFTSCIEASTVLEADAPLREKLRAALAKLPPLQIGKHGQLQEWLEDFDEAEPNHRHTTHLLALYPLDQITPEKTPELAQAARVTLTRRTGQKNWEDVEWSRANLINFFARLGDGEAAYRHLIGLLQEYTQLCFCSTILIPYGRATTVRFRDKRGKEYVLLWIEEAFFNSLRQALFLLMQANCPSIR